MPSSGTNIQVSRDAQVLTVTLSGVVTRADIIDVVRAHYPTLGDRSILWDFSQSEVNALTREDFEAIAAVVGTILPRDLTRKIAYAVADQAGYLKACKYLNAATAARLPAEYAVFTSAIRAREWLVKV